MVTVPTRSGAVHRAFCLSVAPVNVPRGASHSYEIGSPSGSEASALSRTSPPRGTVQGSQVARTVGGMFGGSLESMIVTSTNDGSPSVTSDGNWPSDTVNVSSSLSASSIVGILPEPVVSPAAIVTLSSDPKSSDSAVPEARSSGIVTLLDIACDSRAVTVTGRPSSTGFGDADRLTAGPAGVVGGGGSRLVNVSLAMRTFENLPVPAMLEMTPCGLVSGFDSENSVPSSVPASYGKRSTSSDRTHWPAPSSRDSPDTPTNQSGLGAIMDRSVTCGCSLVTSMVNVAVPVPPPETPSSMTDRVCELRWTSPRKVPVEPSSATNSTPALA